MAIPNTFNSGQKAKASEVNENFTYLSDEIVNERTSLYDDYEVLSGCLVTVNDPIDNAVNIASGKVIINGVIVSVAEQLDEALSNADATSPRYDVICVDNTGVISVITGTPAATPTVPAVTSNKCPLATVLRPAGNNNVLLTNLYDGRYFRNKPFVVSNNTHTSQTGGVGTAGWVTKKTLVVPPFVCKKAIIVKAFGSPSIYTWRTLTGSNESITFPAINILLNNAGFVSTNTYYSRIATSGSTGAGFSGYHLTATNIEEHRTSDDVDFNQFNTFTLQLYRTYGTSSSLYASIGRLLQTRNEQFIIRGE